MQRPSDLAQKEISSCVAGVSAKHEKETILKGVGKHIHLLCANLSAEADIMTASNHVERIGNVEHVRPALKGSESSVA